MTFLVRVIDSREEFQSLAGEWNALVSRSSEYSFAQTFPWAWCSFRASAELQTSITRCVTIWSSDRLVCLWAFVVRRGYSSLARPLSGGGYEEYGGPLIENGPHAAQLARLAWATARSLADRIDIFNLPATSPIRQVISEAEWCWHSHEVVAPFISFDGYADWNVFRNGLSKALRTDIRYQHNRLRKTADLSFELIEEPSERAEMIRWVIGRKREWMRGLGLTASGLNSRWLMTENCTDFLTEVAGYESTLGRLGVFILKLDTKPIAGCINLIDRKKVEYYVTTYDPNFNKYSPGKLLIDYCARWAFDQGLDFDFRIVPAAYKESWANGERTLVSFQVATTYLGYPHIISVLVHGNLRRLKRWIRANLPRRIAEYLRRRHN